MPITNALEERLARVELDLTREQIAACKAAHIGPVLVGEAPGHSTSVHLPLYPWPASSAGGRLMTISKMDTADYLRTFHRINLMRELPERWSNRRAAEAATDLLLSDELRDRPLVLMGTRVAEAFALKKDLHFVAHRGRWIASVPHPSGRNLLLNHEPMRERVRRILWQAVDLWQWPVESPWRRLSCAACGKLSVAHRRHPSGAFVMCPAHPRMYEAARG